MAAKPGIDALTGIPLFAGLSTEELAALLKFSDVSQAKAGDTLVTEGKPSTRLCLLLQGTAEVRKAGSGTKPHVVATLAEKSVFGEVGLVATDNAATATVVATGPAQLCSWERERFRAELGKGSTAAYKVLANLAGVLAERLRSQLTDWTRLVEAADKAGPGGQPREFAAFKQKLLKEWAF